MLNLLVSNPLIFLFTIIGLLVSITIHEFAHAWTADRLGDPTPRMQGRLTLNPLAHLDPVGTIALLLFRFGWGKPVQFDPYNLKNPLRDAAVVALAGPVSNLVLAVFLSLLLRFQLLPYAWVIVAVTQTILINIVLAIFNFVPVHPLDGSKIILAILPRNLSIEYEAIMDRFSIFLLLILIFPLFQGQSLVSILISPIIDLIARVLVP